MLTEKEVALMGYAEAAKLEGGCSPESDRLADHANPDAIIALLNDLDSARFAAAQHLQTVEAQAKILAAQPAPIQSAELAEMRRLAAEAHAVFDLMLTGCALQEFGDYQNGDGETIGPRMDALHSALRAYSATPAQPIADVSAPTDEMIPLGVCWSEQRCDFYAAYTGASMGSAFYDQWRERADDFPDRDTARAAIAARAAAPVSGRAAPADIPILRTMVAIYNHMPVTPDDAPEDKRAEYWNAIIGYVTKWADSRRSGQAASLPRMTEQQVADALAENDPLTMVSIRRLLNGDPVTINLPELTRIVGHCIDSRQRSGQAAQEQAAKVMQAIMDAPNSIAKRMDTSPKGNMLGEFPATERVEQIGDLHAEIMRLIPCVEPVIFASWTEPERKAFKLGHKYARHAAAELASVALAPPAPTAQPLTDAVDPMLQLLTLREQFRAKGWRDMFECPTDTEVEFMEFGSTGIHKGTRLENGDVFLGPDGDFSYPILWRAIDASLSGATPARGEGT